LLLDAPGWAIRNANEHYSIPGPFQTIWFVEYISHPSPNQDVAVVLTAARGHRDDLEAFAHAAPSNEVRETEVFGHPGLIMNTFANSGASSGSWLLWQQTPEVWLMFGSSELPSSTLSQLATQLKVVSVDDWRAATDAVTS
jgi:hypothetical protein